MNRLSTVALPATFTLVGATASLFGTFAERSSTEHATQQDAKTQDAKTQASQTIVDVAVSTGQHRTLVAAVKAAGFVDALSGSEMLTVFAPTDAAFGALESSLIDDLLLPENVETLREVLGYHVVPGRMVAEDLKRETEVRTLSGQRLPVDVRADGVFVGGAKVTTADVRADNGVVHVVDTVMLPATDDVVTVARNAGAFTTLLTALGAADLVEVVNGDTPLTILAPTDAAFAALDQELLGGLLEPDSKARLASVLKMHVIAGRYSALELAAFGTVETLAGTRLPVRVVDGRLTVGGAPLSGNDVESTNATVHVLDAVILPH